MKSYDHKKVEKKAQNKWEKEKVFNASNGSKKPKYYALMEFPYPSGDGLHVGHVRGFTAMDIIARKKRAQGFNVLYPIGWDAFGLPTENFAIKTGLQPALITKKNTDNFRKQFKSLGMSFDWSREINTTDPKYYKWTQWIFLKLLEHGLAYKARMPINWCPKDKIGLANEEVIDGKCERCGTPVEKKEKEQWMLAITKYADRLDKDLDSVDYLEKIKLQQRNWIGKSVGAEIDFQLTLDNGNTLETITVYTTRPDTIFGATYLVLSPEHPWVTKVINNSNKKILDNQLEVKKYVAEAGKRTEIDRTSETKKKTGVLLKGVTAINPANNKKIPVYVADYVLAHYGTGALMAVPAHDERDFDFAKKYNLPIKQVITPIFTDKVNPTKPGVESTERQGVIILVKHWSEEKYLLNYSPKYNWKCLFTGGIEEGENPLESAVREIQEETGYQNTKVVRYIPLEHIDKFHAPHKGVNRVVYQKNVFIQLADGEKKEISEEEKELHHLSWLTESEMREAITLPNHLYIFNTALLNGQSITDEGVLAHSGKFNGKNSEEIKKEITTFVGGRWVTKFKLRDWVFSRQRYWGEPIPVIHCLKCGTVPVPEKDLPVTLPKVKNYQPTDSGESPLASITSWVNVKCPKCKGPAQRETDTMPNWAGSSWYFLRYADPENSKSFALRKKLDYWLGPRALRGSQGDVGGVDWYNGGMEHTTLHLLYSRFWNKFLFDIKQVPTSEPYQKRTSHGLILAQGGEKMSKSKGNVINPDEIVKLYGADTLRVYEMFLGPFDQAVAWSEEGIIGPRRFLERVWKLQYKISKNKKLKPTESIERITHQTIRKVTEAIDSMSFNTAISSLMIFANECEKGSELSFETFETLLVLLSPFAPHITEELWNIAGNKRSIILESWPLFIESKTLATQCKIIIQINGKTRATLDVAFDAPNEDIQEKALLLPEVKKWIEGSQVKRVIFVKNKLINIVV